MADAATPTIKEMNRTDFVTKYGEAAIPKAFAAYHNQRLRSKGWRSGVAKEAEQFRVLKKAMEADPKLAALAKQHGITL